MGSKGSLGVVVQPQTLGRQSLSPIPSLCCPLLQLTAWPEWNPPKKPHSYTERASTQAPPSSSRPIRKKLNWQRLGGGVRRRGDWGELSGDRYELFSSTYIVSPGQMPRILPWYLPPLYSVGAISPNHNSDFHLHNSACSSPLPKCPHSFCCPAKSALPL